MKIVLALAILPLLMFGELVRAQDSVSSTFPQGAQPTEAQMLPHVGLMVGMANPEGNPSAGEIGMNIGFQPYIPFGVGAEVVYFRSNGDHEIRRTQTLATVSYNFGGSNDLLRHTYVGLGAGAAFNNDGTDLVSAPMLGFDIPFRKEDKTVVSVGAVAKYSIVEGSAQDSFSVDGVVKFWF